MARLSRLTGLSTTTATKSIAVGNQHSCRRGLLSSAMLTCSITSKNGEV